MLRSLLSLYIWVVWVIHLLVVVPVVILTLFISKQAGLLVLRSMIRSAFFLTGIRVKVTGAETVDWRNPHVLMANHQNLLDPFIFVLGIPRIIVGLEKIENFKIPIYGQLIRAWGQIPVDRGNSEAARASLDVAAERMAQGVSVVVLPEGTRSKTGAMGPFKKGGFHLALSTQTNIVPFTINGAYQILEGRPWRLRPGVIELIFSSEIAIQDYDVAHIDTLVERVRSAIESNLSPRGNSRNEPIKGARGADTGG